MAMKDHTRQKRDIGARDILREATKTLPDVRSFLEDDKTALIAGICLTENQRDPHTICLQISPNRQRWPTADMRFTRLLAARFLALEYSDWQRRRYGLRSSFSGRRPDNYGERGIFMRDSDLPDISQIRRSLECGEKLLRLERGTGKSGISLAMMFTFSRFPHFYDGEIEHAIHLLHSRSYSDIMGVAENCSEEMEKYTVFYRKCMATLSKQAQQLHD